MHTNHEHPFSSPLLHPNDAFNCTFNLVTVFFSFNACDALPLPVCVIIQLAALTDWENLHERLISMCAWPWLFPFQDCPYQNDHPKYAYSSQSRCSQARPCVLCRTNELFAVWSFALQTQASLGVPILSNLPQTGSANYLHVRIFLLGLCTGYVCFTLICKCLCVVKLRLQSTFKKKRL